MSQVATLDAPLSNDPSGGGWRRVDGPGLASPDACRLALAAYERAFHMCTVVEPDVGFAEQYATGWRSLEARSNADAWVLTADRAAALARLLDEMERAGCEDAGDWIDRFPRVVLGILDRRATAGSSPDMHGRRFADRARPPEPIARGSHPGG